MPFGQRRVYGDMVIEYLSAARRRNLFCDDEHEVSLFKGTNVRLQIAFQLIRELKASYQVNFYTLLTLFFAFDLRRLLNIFERKLSKLRLRFEVSHTVETHNAAKLNDA